MKPTRFFRERDWNELKMYKEQMELIQNCESAYTASAAKFHLDTIKQEMSDRAFRSLSFLECLDGEKATDTTRAVGLSGLSAILYGKDKE